VAATRRPPAVARVLERVTGTVRRHDLIPPGSKVLLAVSGGGDSMCLLHAMYALRRLLRIRLAVVHVDHAQRPESEADARYVRRAAEKLGLACTVYRVGERIARGASPEAWLREQRYRLFEHAADDTGSDLVATAHTANDQAETVLTAALRGGGLEAVAGIPPARDRFVRPMLDVTREETHAACRALRIRPRPDPMNQDRRYLRAALRHDVIPALERATGRGVVEALARTGEGLRGDAELLRLLAEDAAAEVATENGTAWRLHAVRLRELPVPVGSRVVLHVLRALGAREATRAHVESVLDLATGRPGRRVDLPGGLVAVRERSSVRLSR